MDILKTLAEEFKIKEEQVKETVALIAVICNEEKPRGVRAFTKSPDVPQSTPAIMIYKNAFLFI